MSEQYPYLDKYAHDEFEEYASYALVYQTYKDLQYHQHFAEDSIDEFRSRRREIRTIVPQGEHGGLISFKEDYLVDDGGHWIPYSHDHFTWKRGDPYYRSADYGR